MKKILYVLNSGNFGGMERHVVNLVAAASEEYNVYVWCRSGPLVAELNKFGAKVTIRNINFDIDPLYIVSLIAFLKDTKIDIIHSHELKAVTNALLAGWIAGVKVRISHTHTPLSEWPVQALLKTLEIFGYSNLINFFGTVEIALTETRKAVKSEEGIRPSKLYILPNCVEDSFLGVSAPLQQEYKREVYNKFNISPSTFLFGYVSRLSPEKGHLILLDAFAKFLQNSTVDNKNNIKLLFAGEGPMRSQIEAKINDLGLVDTVILAGGFSEEYLVKFHSAIDIFVFPSLAEGFGIVLIEAMSLGVPVICSDLAVLQEVGGSTVIYFETGSSESLAQKMADLYSKRQKLAHLEDAEQQRVKDLYTFQKFKDSYLSLYKTLLTS